MSQLYMIIEFNLRVKHYQMRPFQTICKSNFFLHCCFSAIISCNTLYSQWIGHHYGRPNMPIENFFNSSIEEEYLRLVLFADRDSHEAMLILEDNGFLLSCLPGEECIVNFELLGVDDKSDTTYLFNVSNQHREMDYLLSRNLWTEMEGLTNAFFSAKKIVLKSYRRQESTSYTFNMNGNQELKKYLSNYIEYDRVFFKLNDDECLERVRFNAKNFTDETVLESNIILRVETDSDLLYNNQFQIQLNLNSGAVSTFEIEIPIPVCLNEDEIKEMEINVIEERSVGFKYIKEIDH